MQDKPERGPGFFADTGGIKGIAAQLEDAASDMRARTAEMRDVMFGGTTEPGATTGPALVFGGTTAGGATLGRKFDDLIAEVASYGQALGETMSAAAGQLRTTGDIYARTEHEISGN
ncbi:hypothetical protein AB0M83_17710 [Amycolatopsis sp. NPDC051106]|uniref:hypothetical protein n=1 Tax=unclassified Amycolatopsis TaxID=2618356 RepID=UPI00341F4AD5